MKLRNQWKVKIDQFSFQEAYVTIQYETMLQK